MARTPKRVGVGTIYFLLFWILWHAAGNDTESSRKESEYWQENWHEHNQNLTRIFDDDNLAFYKDSGTRPIKREVFNAVSQNWLSITEIYNSTHFGNDSKLHFILHDKKYNGVHIALHTEKSHGFRNVIDCGHGDPEKEEDTRKCSSAVLYLQMANLTTKLVTRSSIFPAHLVSDWKLEDLILFSIMVQVDSSVAHEYAQEKIEEVANFPQNGVKLFRNFYADVYNGYGKDEVVRHFTQLMTLYASKDPSLLNRAIFPGEFVHFWSQAAGHDIRILAYKGFGWTQDYQTQFLLAQTKYPVPRYTDTFSNASIFAPPKSWNENWSDHSKDLALEGIYGYVAVYVDSETAEGSTGWLVSPVLEAWGYLKETYGPFGPDPYLYIVLHEGNSNECVTSKQGSSYVNEDFEGRIVLDCQIVPLGKSNEPTEQEKQIKLDTIFRILSVTTLCIAKETGNWPAHQVTEWKMADILVYDLYLKLGKREDAERWATKQLESQAQTWKGVPLFRNWFYPIYKQFNGSVALNQFFSTTNLFWPKNGTDYISDFNVGEFVHFWSMAVNFDLQNLAANALKDLGYHQKLLQDAQRTYPNFSYLSAVPGHIFPPPNQMKETWLNHSDHVVQLYQDENVLFYTDTQFKTPTSMPFKTISNSWRRIKVKYNSEPLLIVLHSGKLPGCRAVYVPSNLGPLFGITLTMDCQLHQANSNSTSDVHSTQDLLLKGLFSITLLPPKFKRDDTYLQKQLTEVHLPDILVYDSYVVSQNYEDAVRWKKISQSKLSNPCTPLRSTTNTSTSAHHEKMGASPGNVNLFGNWYLPIYSRPRGTKMLEQFLDYLQVYKHPEKQSVPNSDSDVMSVGEFVHFWSGAGGINLEYLANSTFGNCPNYYPSLISARSQYPLIEYANYTEDMKDGKGGYEGKNEVTIIAISVTVVLLGIAFVLLIFYWQRRKIRTLQAQVRKLTENEIRGFFEGTSAQGKTTGNASIEAEPFKKELEILPDRIETMPNKILGSGEYGLVLQGTLKLQSETENKTECVVVAIKTPKPDVDVTTFKALLTELKVMGHLGTHEHVIKLYGAVTANIRNRELLVALEFCSRGDLLNNLKNGRPFFKHLLKLKSTGDAGKNLTYLNIPSSSEIELEQMPTSSTNYENVKDEFTALNLLEWSRQISNGMNFIGLQNVIHGDLAARNVLLTANNVVKISDFGLSRQLVNYSNYIKTSQTPVPWRWMALESLRDMEFSPQSDVWAFGVTLYEIFSLGSVPYPGGNWTNEFVDQLSAGFRLSMPEFGNEDIYELMMDCMKKEPSERIPFSALTIKLQNLKTKLFPAAAAARKNSNYLDINPEHV